MSLPTPAGRYLSAEDLEVVYDQKKFQDAAEIDDVHLLHFKHDRTLFVRVPVNSSDQNPHDGYIWGQTKYGKDRVVVFRHQPTRKIIELYGAKCTSLNCTELNQPHIRKQIFQYQDQIYCYYFTTTDEPISIPSEGLFPVKKKRLTKNRADILTRLVIPGRTVKQALSTAREMGMTDVTKKQVLNVSRRCVDCVFTKNGPRARTSLAMAEKIKQENPDLTWFEQTNNVLTEFTSIRVFKDACKIFYEGCPPLDEWEAYTELVEDMINDKHLRESELPKLYDHYPNGVFFPSRLHVDTTYRLSDMYITVVLGETGNFLTKPSGKARVIPLLYMLHSSRSRITHEKAALALKEALMEHSNPLSPKKFPCLLLDGEEALQVYGEVTFLFKSFNLNRYHYFQTLNYTESFDQRCIECPVGSLCATSSNTTDIFCIVRYKLNEIPVGNSCSIPLIVISLVVGLLLLLNTISIILIIRRRRIQVYDLPPTIDERSAVCRAEVDLMEKVNKWKTCQDDSLIEVKSGNPNMSKDVLDDVMNGMYSDDMICEENNGIPTGYCADDGKSEENWAEKTVDKVENRKIDE
ncbi:hypothetical protein CRE_25902 [Caenorhabditis remanei]|uniref:Uncharacterized protein n=1 Tax=Caenorhabditis remanei TaxID=31234 RepID=E3NGE3_CAERE|nr:hypothetical protein CRE_25902 [Caenorhabditis remanei]